MSVFTAGDESLDGVTNLGGVWTQTKLDWNISFADGTAAAVDRTVQVFSCPVKMKKMANKAGIFLSGEG